MLKTLSRLVAVAAMLLALAAPANAHYHGKDSPSTGWTGYSGGAGLYHTNADDNVTDGHCVFIRYWANGQWNNDGAYSCGPTVTKWHTPFPSQARLCVTGHWSNLNSGACRSNLP